MRGAVQTERGASSRPCHSTSRGETAVKETRSPRNADAFRLPRAPLRGAPITSFRGIPDRRFAGCFREVSSMRRTSIPEIAMSHSVLHPHAEFDRFPQLIEEFGAGFVDAVIAAEEADFAWDSRFAEHDLGARRVRIIGYFRRRYLVATCLVDGKRRVRALLKLCRFDCLAEAEAAFLEGGG